MSEAMIDLGHGFWNIRGDLRIGGVLNIGTQCSLIRLSEGRFVFLDSYTLTGELRERVMALTDRGTAVQAVLNLHPFHTLHCARMAADFPCATFHGSARHRRQVPQVDWAADAVEGAAVAARYQELAFSMPEGIDYISEREGVHAGSLLAFHPPSGALHVNDTFNVLPVPELVRRVLPVPRIAFHPTLPKALDDRPDAAMRFCDWAGRIGRDWSGTRALCAAHSALARFETGGFRDALDATIAKARPTLSRARS